MSLWHKCMPRSERVFYVHTKLAAKSACANYKYTFCCVFVQLKNTPVLMKSFLCLISSMSLPCAHFIVNNLAEGSSVYCLSSPRSLCHHSHEGQYTVIGECEVVLFRLFENNLYSPESTLRPSHRLKHTQTAKLQYLPLPLFIRDTVAGSPTVRRGKMINIAKPYHF
jgi:hypothetical protein